MQNLEEILALGEDIDFLIVVSHCLVEDVALGAVVHAFHYFFLSVQLVVKLLLEDVAFEMVLVVGLPGAGAHVAKALTACASHKIAPHRPLHCLLAPRTDFSILGNPFGIGLFFDNLLDPLGLFLALAGVVIVALTPEAEDFPASAGDCI
jgi:hypothetical protein